MVIRTAPVVAGSLIGGFAVAQASGIRALGGIVLVAGGAVAGLDWIRKVGPARTAGLVAIYLVSFVASHPLAKVIGTWPAVLTAAAVSAAAAWLVSDRLSDTHGSDARATVNSGTVSSGTVAD